MKFYYVYHCTHEPSQRYYIGQHVSKLIVDENYRGTGIKWKCILRKHNKKEFSIKILAYAQNQDELNELEKKFIGELYLTDKNCCNLMEGGGAKGHYSEESKKKISASNKGKHHTEETKKKMSESHKGEKSYNYGRKFSKETCEKISKSREKYKGENHPQYGRRGKDAVNYGSHRTEETKKKMSDSGKGKHFASDETKKKMRENHANYQGENHPLYGKKVSEETKKKMSETLKNGFKNGRKILSRKVIQIETGKIFLSCSSAAREVGVTNGAIIMCCQGKRNTIKGFHWKYFDK